jgi:hypothetical protein
MSSMARQYRDIQNELQQYLKQFSSGAQVSGNAYGNLSASDTAAKSYSASTDSMIDNLQALYRECGQHADALEDAVRAYEGTDGDSARSMQSLAA